MFSRAERAFLERVAHGPREPTWNSVESRFPNPVYRRKLMWGIRQKASRSISDWQLYCEAAEQDARLLPHAGGKGPSPVFADPLVTLLEDFRRMWTLRRRPPALPELRPRGKQG